MLCHKPDKRGGHEIEVSKSALPAHMAHGDTEGACESTGTTSTASTTTAAAPTTLAPAPAPKAKVKKKKPNSSQSSNARGNGKTRARATETAVATAVTKRAAARSNRPRAITSPHTKGGPHGPPFAFNAHVRIAVVGAGINGLAAAATLARDGHEVVVHEQYELDHQSGSSHGRSRIFRLSYPEPQWVELAKEAHQGWRALEEETGERLIEYTGLLELGETSEDALDACDVAWEPVEPDAAALRFGIRADGRGLLQPEAGISLADRARRAFATVARRHGATLDERAKVESLAALDADAVVVTAGGWAKPSARGRGHRARRHGHARDGRLLRARTLRPVGDRVRARPRRGDVLAARPAARTEGGRAHRRRRPRTPTRPASPTPHSSTRPSSGCASASRRPARPSRSRRASTPRRPTARSSWSATGASSWGRRARATASSSPLRSGRVWPRSPRGNLPPCRSTSASATSRGSVTCSSATTARLLTEEVMGLEGFSGNESILYHLTSPCRVQKLGDFKPIKREEWVPDAHAHRHFTTWDTKPEGDPGQRPQAVDVEQRRRDLARAPDRAHGLLLPQRRGRRGVLRARGRRHARDDVRRPDVRAGRLHRDPARHDVPVRARLAARAPPALRDAGPDRDPEALPQQLRPADGARAVLPPRHPRARPS